MIVRRKNTRKKRWRSRRRKEKKRKRLLIKVMLGKEPKIGEERNRKEE